MSRPGADRRPAVGRGVQMLGRVLMMICACAAMSVAPDSPAHAAARVRAALVIDADTDRVLYERRADRLVYPASLAKMMTLYLAFDALKSGKYTLKSRLKVSRKAEGQPPTKLGLRRGQTITMEQAILGLITRSANDAAMVVAEALAGNAPAFAQKMTEKARALGMRKTVFRNPSGLHNRSQRTTARDMVRLSQTLLRDHADHYKYFSTKRFRYRKSTYSNHNKLLFDYPGADGIKTGFINASGFNLAASAKRNGRRLIGVVFGEDNTRARNRRMTDLLDQGFLKLKKQGLFAEFPRPSMPPAAKILSPATQIALAERRRRAIAKTTFLRRAPDPVLVAAAGKAETLPPGRGWRMRIAALPPGRRWGIQVGAFRNALRAQRAVIEAARKAPGMRYSRPAIDEHVSAQGRLFRARLIGVTESEAREACRFLSKRAISCQTVTPETEMAG